MVKIHLTPDMRASCAYEVAVLEKKILCMKECSRSTVNVNF